MWWIGGLSVNRAVYLRCSIPTNTANRCNLSASLQVHAFCWVGISFVRKVHFQLTAGDKHSWHARSIHQILWRMHEICGPSRKLTGSRSTLHHNTQVLVPIRTSSRTGRKKKRKLSNCVHANAESEVCSLAKPLDNTPLGNHSKSNKAPVLTQRAHLVHSCAVRGVVHVKSCTCSGLVLTNQTHSVAWSTHPRRCTCSPFVFPVQVWWSTHARRCTCSPLAVYHPTTESYTHFFSTVAADLGHVKPLNTC